MELKEMKIGEVVIADSNKIIKRKMTNKVKQMDKLSNSLKELLDSGRMDAHPDVFKSKIEDLKSIVDFFEKNLKNYKLIA